MFRFFAIFLLTITTFTFSATAGETIIGGTQIGNGCVQGGVHIKNGQDVSCSQNQRRNPLALNLGLDLNLRIPNPDFTTPEGTDDDPKDLMRMFPHLRERGGVITID